MHPAFLLCLDGSLLHLFSPFGGLLLQEKIIAVGGLSYTYLLLICTSCLSASILCQARRNEIIYKLSIISFQNKGTPPRSCCHCQMVKFHWQQNLLLVLDKVLFGQVHLPYIWQDLLCHLLYILPMRNGIRNQYQLGSGYMILSQYHFLHRKPGQTKPIPNSTKCLFLMSLCHFDRSPDQLTYYNPPTCTVQGLLAR